MESYQKHTLLSPWYIHGQNKFLADDQNNLVLHNFVSYGIDSWIDGKQSNRIILIFYVQGYLKNKKYTFASYVIPSMTKFVDMCPLQKLYIYIILRQG